jgi:hypothetical protein
MLKRISTLIFVSFFPFWVLAYTSVIAEPQNQAVVLPIKDPEHSQEFFGVLTDFPHTFSFEVKEPGTFKAEVFVNDADGQKNDASIIIVKEERRGVSEIGRTVITQQSWFSTYDKMFAESFRTGGALTGELQKGRYKLEVSAPNNDALYRLVLGCTCVVGGKGTVWTFKIRCTPLTTYLCSITPYSAHRGCILFL